MQYGLKALNAKTISVDQFLLVNQAAGGYTIDGRHQPQREVADPVALQASYEDGRVSIGAGDQRKVPIIDVNIYTDPAGDIHDRFRAVLAAGPPHRGRPRRTRGPLWRPTSRSGPVGCPGRP